MSFKVNISIDDVSPHPRASILVVERCKKLINLYPDIKFTLFVPIAYWQTMPRSGILTSTPKPLNIDKYEKFCKYLDKLPEKNFELCYHGLYHGIPFKSNNDEFQYLNFEEAREKFGLMFDITKKANLFNKFKKIFRPPAWRMSPDAIKAAKHVGIQVLALSPDEYALKTYQGEQKAFKDVVYYNVNPPFKELKLFEKTEMVYHACEWDRNHLGEEKIEELSNFIEKNKDEIEFCYISELLE